jgi:sporulation protein YlmC with PRC-barrel domain
MRLELGTPVRCADGVLGELMDVVVDPTSRRVTHLVVGPKAEPGDARLVPIALADPDDDSPAIVLACTREDAAALESLDEVAYLRADQIPVADPDWDVGVEDYLAMPYYSATGIGDDPGLYDTHVTISYHRVPKGEVEVRRSSLVTSSDDHLLGRVDGFVVDAGQHITHLVLERGHLWGRREVTIPIGAVAAVETDAVTIDLTREQVGELPSARVHRWSR